MGQYKNIKYLNFIYFYIFTLIRKEKNISNTSIVHGNLDGIHLHEKTVLSHTKISCILSYHREFSTNDKIEIIGLAEVLISSAFGSNKTG